MKTRVIIFSLLLVSLLLSCNQSNVPDKYQALVDQALANAGDNKAELEKALNNVPKEQKEGVAFLIAYMPEVDLKSITGEYLLDNVDLAYKARERFSWAKNIPDSIFLNDVLPYASVNELRDNWRFDFYTRFSSYVENCETLEEAVRAINKNIMDEVKVEYNTKRKKPDQSPSESMEIGMASCTGLSILLVDAFRAVGIPARMAGTAKWHDNRGNHTWCEVWLDGKWYFTEYYFEDLDRAWFIPDAGKAKLGDPIYAVYATSFKPTDKHFPMVWARNITYVPAVDVSQHYIDVYNEINNQKKTDGNHVKMTVRMYKDKNNTKHSEDRVKVNVDVFMGNDQIGGGSTAGPTQDMNDVLEFFVEKNKEYTLKYFPDGKSFENKVKVDNEPIDVVLYLE